MFTTPAQATVVNVHLVNAREILRSTEPEVAARLLGSTLRCGGVSGVIVETEFYRQDDPASHTFGGRTPRNWPMFEQPGTLYVYRSYGIHWCANVVVGPPDHGCAVLIRALRPDAGVNQMWERRPKARKPTDLCSGPGKVCAALGIQGSHSGSDSLKGLDGVSLEFADPVDPQLILSGPRIGISKAVDQPWRFAVRGDQNVSRPVHSLG